MVPISLRMKTIADMVPQGLSVADIGCDHGFVAIYLVTERQAPKAVAMDVNEGPLIRAKEHIEQYGLTEVITTRLSDGARELEQYETDAAVIAGMGGRLTIKILEESLEKFMAMKCFVLSPHSDIFLVRDYLGSKGFEISDEEMVYDEGKYYVIMRCSLARGHRELSKIQKEYGPILLEKKHAVLKEYLEKELVKKTEIVGRLNEETGESKDTKAEAVKRRIAQIEADIDEISNILKGM